MGQESIAEKIRTADNSSTFFSEEYGEAYHSASGAISEAFNKFIVPCRIETLARGGKIRILDIGFGLGYNVLAALHAARSVREDCELEIISLERFVLSRARLDMLEVPPGLSRHYDMVKSLAQERDLQRDGINLRLIEGDARENIGKTKAPFDAVFLDPFSPKKNPELWTLEFFGQMALRMTETAILATYSSATPVRCGLMAAGLKIGPGPGDAMKRGGTLATKNGEIPVLSEKEARRLEISPERRPYRDPGLSLSSEDILEYRKNTAPALP